MINAVSIIILAAILGSSVPSLAKIALEVLPPFTLVMARFFLATLVLLPFIKKNNELNKKIFKNLFWIAVIGALNPILLFIGLQFTKASIAPLIYAVVPSLTALYLIFYKETKLSKLKIFGIIIGFIGAAIVILIPAIESQQIFNNKVGSNLLIFGAVIAFSVYSLMSKSRQVELKISPIALTFYFCLVTFILSLPFSIFEYTQNPSFIYELGSRHILAIIAVGIMGTSLFYLSYQYALKLNSALSATLFTYLQPVFGIILAMILLSEKISVFLIVGGILAIYGAHIASGNKLKISKQNDKI